MSKTLERIGLAACLAAFICVCCWISFQEGQKRPKIVEKVDTLVTVRFDTIREKYPVYLTERVVDSVRVVIHDTTYIEVPITQKHYHKDSLFDAWVSGFLPQLDSINVFPKTETVEVVRWQKVEPSRWSFGATAGLGVVVDGQGAHAGPAVAFGLQYRF